jgi:peptidoglycan/xylan/chitin deacetylase (PgdA/CDA1 family)
MSTAVQFENRRRDRNNRQRRRKKRIRAAILLIALICIVVLICIAVSMKSHSNNDNALTQSAAQSVQSEQEELPADTESTDKTGNLPPASSENNLLTLISNSGQTKRCYLTFDDGPTTNITPQVLDILRRYNVKATFFEVGSLIEANPDMARRVYEEGHLIANHSDGHNYAKLYVSTDTFMTEINKCYDSIKSVTDGEEPFRLIRFPGGSYNSSADSYSPVKQKCKETLKENGFYYCDWNALTGDAEGKTKNASELLAYLKQNLNTNKNAIILMHDAAAKQATADALPSVIEYLMSEGYTFHRLDDIDYQGSEITPTASPSSSKESSASATASPSASSKSSTESASSTPSPSPKATATPRPTTPPASSGGMIIID